jgi:hypothetical protein
LWSSDWRFSSICLLFSSTLFTLICSFTPLIRRLKQK